KAIFFILGRIFRPCPQAQCHIAPSAKTEICIPISEKYSQIILNTYLKTTSFRYCGRIGDALSLQPKIKKQRDGTDLCNATTDDSPQPEVRSANNIHGVVAARHEGADEPHL
ncbi:MAG: hypothetical protein K6E73_05405, partial [Bacteroidales bacterium]|nr:hypothetical protein [Bacteroidales bacterium]